MNALDKSLVQSSVKGIVHVGFFQKHDRNNLYPFSQNQLKNSVCEECEQRVTVTVTVTVP